MLTIEQVNTLTKHDFIDLFGGIFEHSPWITEMAFETKPFSSVEHLHKEMVSIIKKSTNEQKLTLLKEHPNLGDRVEMSPDSVNEQKGAGLKDLTPEEYDQFITINRSYMEKFGFPFIIAVRGKSKEQIYKAMEARIQNSVETEFETALEQTYQIGLLRLQEKINE